MYQPFKVEWLFLMNDFLKEIFQKDVITCPFCRKTSVHADSTSRVLPNNDYALHMLKLKENMAKQTIEVIEAP